MLTDERIDQLLAEAGSVEPRIGSVDRLDDGGWIVSLDGVDVEVEISPDRYRLVFTTNLGAPLEVGRTAVLEALLSYNIHWRDTGNVRLALTGPTGDAAQIVDLVADQLTPSTVATVLANAAEKTVAWRGILADGPGEAEAPEPIADDGMMIRI